MPNIAALITVAAVMFALLGAIMLIAHIYNLNNIKSKTVGDGQHGTARWQTKRRYERPTATFRSRQRKGVGRQSKTKYLP